MDALEFQPGNGRLVSSAPGQQRPWQVIFEDEGSAAYAYACDQRLGRTGASFEDTVLDAVLIYRTAEAPASVLVTIEWSADSNRAALRVNGVPQALFDFSQGHTSCRSNFPNFMDDGRSPWRRSDHSWKQAAMDAFEQELLDRSATPSEG